MFNNTNTKTCWNSMNPFLCHQLIVINIRFLPPSHRTGDYEGTTPRSVNAVNPGVYRFWLSPHTRAEESPCRAAVSVNAGIRRRYSAWCVRLEYLYPLKGISVKLSRVGYKPLSSPPVDRLCNGYFAFASARLRRRSSFLSAFAMSMNACMIEFRIM